MIAVLDANVVMALLGALKGSLNCPRTSLPVDQLEGRVAALLQRMSENNSVGLIPAPAMAEVLVKVDASKRQEYLDAISNISCLSIAPFDEKCVITCSDIISPIEAKQIKTATDTRAKIAVDRQILTIVKVSGADEIWTHDKLVFNKASTLEITAKSLSDIPPIPIQDDIFAERQAAP